MHFDCARMGVFEGEYEGVMVKMWTNIKLGLGFCLLLLSSTVFADDGLATLSADATSITMSITYLIKVLLWIGGAGLILGGIVQYKAHRVNPSQVRLIKPVMLFIVGIILVLLPLVMNKILQANAIYG